MSKPQRIFSSQPQGSRGRRRNKAKKKSSTGTQPQIPKTIESMAKTEFNDGPIDVELLAIEDRCDEFANVFAATSSPMVAVTTCRRPSPRLRTFIKELLALFHGSVYLARDEVDLEALVKTATRRGFTALLLLTQDSKKNPNGIYISTLPAGPTAHYSLSSLTMASDMKATGSFALVPPEVVVNNFTSILAHRVARQLASLFSVKPQLEARRVVTFHNQRDCIFVRHHRYDFKNAKKCNLHEIGPKFTLRLRSLQRGAMDLEHGLYEHVWRADTQVDRKLFYL